jgi:hypothetical protein
MTKAVAILTGLVLLLSVLLGASIKSGFEKSDKIEQLQQSIKAVNNAQKVIYKIREVTKDEDCYYKELPEEALKELKK